METAAPVPPAPGPHPHLRAVDQPTAAPRGECASCGHVNLHDSRFCSQCGARLPETQADRGVVYSVQFGPQQSATIAASSGAAPADEAPNVSALMALVASPRSEVQTWPGSGELTMTIDPPGAAATSAGGPGRTSRSEAPERRPAAWLLGLGGAAFLAFGGYYAYRQQPAIDISGLPPTSAGHTVATQPDARIELEAAATEARPPDSGAWPSAATPLDLPPPAGAAGARLFPPTQPAAFEPPRPSAPSRSAPAAAPTAAAPPAARPRPAPAPVTMPAPVAGPCTAAVASLGLCNLESAPGRPTP